MAAKENYLPPCRLPPPALQTALVLLIGLSFIMTADLLWLLPWVLSTMTHEYPSVFNESPSPQIMVCRLCSKVASPLAGFLVTGKAVIQACDCLIAVNP